MVLKKHKLLWITGLFVSILVLTLLGHSHNYDTSEETSESFLTSFTNNFNIVPEILNSKLDDYTSLGYFPQIYQPSLQATYYALSILDEIGRLSDINQTRMLNYIMSCYNQSSYTFADDYSQRYLDMNISKTYYPYSSLLEINCYAILSLEILNSLILIDVQESIDFIWDCYQPTTSGFIGKPYNSNLPDYFKVSTMDNTYFAIVTLDLLMNDWNNHITEKNELIQYIQDLQSTNVFYWYFGGFENDIDHTIDTIDLFEPNLLSSYYCIKSLDIFGVVDVINIDNFHQYLDGLYDPATYSFQMSHFLLENYGNIAGTSLGLILSDLTSYTGIDRTNIVNFILINRNNRGTWNYSTEYLYCELIDTFQVIRSLSDSGEISLLTESDKNMISNTIRNFTSYKGFSLLSKDYTSINLLYTIINSFDLYNRTSELDDQYFYSIIENSYVYNSLSDCDGFMAGTIFEDSWRKYRSFPIEYYCSGDQNHLQQVEPSLVSHKHTYNALESFRLLGKLNNFAETYNLTKLLTSILKSQFLIFGYDNYGGFLPFLSFSLGSPEYQNEKIFIDYSYFVIATIELLSDYLGLGDMTSLDFDVSALSNYIHNNIFEDENFQYFSPGYTMNPETLIENTFYAIFILKSIDSFDLDEIKIKNFVLNHINYSNIKSVYYTYKISKLIEEIIPLDYDLIYQLIGDIYSEEYKEYYLTNDKYQIYQEVLLWVAEMVVNDLGNSMTYVNIDHLESCKFLSTGNNITFTINANYSGMFWYWVDGILVDSDAFNPNGDVFVYSLDGFATIIKDYTIKINATALDGSYGEVVSTFSVYSDSSTIIDITSLSGCKFLSTCNNITFHIEADYDGTYWYWVDGTLVDFDTFHAYGETFVYSLDLYTDTINDYTVKINATALDGHYGETTSVFSVYSDSSTLINITSLENCMFLSTGNNITFHIEADYNGTYWYWVDGELIDSGIFNQDYETFIYFLDEFTDNIKDYDVKINATALDGHYGEVTATFSVYSDSSTVITIDQLNDYEFMTLGNTIIFHINSQYPDRYNFTIDGIEISSDPYYDGQSFQFSIDGYAVGNHNVTIWAIGLDGLEGNAITCFTVFSNSETIITIHSIENYIYDTLEHIVNFSVSSSYPDSYIVKIDGGVIDGGKYSNNQPILCSIDGYNVGIHTLLIWANGSDGKESTLSVQFNVFTHSFIEIDIIDLPNYEFQTIGNVIVFYINASFPDTVKFYIDGIFNWSGSYNHSGQFFILSIDRYNVSEHSITIWANSTDGSEASIQSSFTVYSLSNTIIKIAELPDYEFLTTGHYIKFNISSSYPDYFNIYIDGFLIDTHDFVKGQYYYYSIDGYTISNHSVFIWAIGLDGKIGTASAEFDVYSNSTTIININSVPNYIFMSSENYINFSISSQYIGSYNISIDGILVDNDSYIPEEILLCLIDGYEVGTHFVNIITRSIDAKLTIFNTTFSVYSNSSTIIIINELQGCEYLSMGNLFNFSIFSEYPNYYKLWIDGILVSSNNYTNGCPILFSLDNYTSIIGNHSVEIWAIGKDYEESYISAEFNVYSTSVTLISIHGLEGCEFLSTSNYLNFSISSDYPDYFELWINGELVFTDVFISEEVMLFSLDNYTNILGNNTVYIWAIGLDGKEASVIAQFSVYSISVTLISIHHLEGFEFLSTGNYLNFSIYSNYPAFYELWIDNVLVLTDNYSSGEYILYSLDYLSSVLGNYSIYIWAIGLDGKIGTLIAEFSVYSSSSTVIRIDILNDAEFLSNKYNMTFSIHSDYPDYYELWIDGTIVQIDHYINSVPITFSLDNYTASIGTHTIFIWAIGLDGKIGINSSEFNIYSSSITIINVNFLDDYEFNSTGNTINFTIFSEYPDHFTFSIDNAIRYSNNYVNGQLFSVSIDGFGIGTHHITIWARGLDGKETEVIAKFLVYKKEQEVDNPSLRKNDNINVISGVLISILIGGPGGAVILSSHKDLKKLWRKLKTHIEKQVKKTERAK